MKVFILIFTLVSFANEEIICSDSSCSFTSGITDVSHLEQADNHLISLNENAEFSISVIKPLGENPKNLKMSVEFIDENQNAEFQIGSQTQGIKATDVLFFSNMINSLSIIANGYNGVPRNSATKNCAYKIKNGEFGQDVLDNFNNRRSSGLSDEYCIADDINDIKLMKFSCDDPTFSEISSSFDVNRWKERQSCAGGLTVNMCVEKKIQLVCSWASVGHSQCCDQTGTTYQPAGSGWTCDPNACSPSELKTGFVKTQSTTVNETDYLLASNNKTDEQICDNYFYRQRSKDDWNDNSQVISAYPSECGGDACSGNFVNIDHPSIVQSAKIVSAHFYPGYALKTDHRDRLDKNSASSWFNYPINREVFFNSVPKSYKRELGVSESITGFGMCDFGNPVPPAVSSGTINYSPTAFKVGCKNASSSSIQCEFGGGYGDAGDCSGSYSRIGYLYSDAANYFTMFIEYEIVNEYGYIYKVIQYAGIYAN